MDWQFKAAIGAAVLFFLLPYWVKDMPQSITNAGIAAAILFGLWGLPWVEQRISALPGLLLILGFCGIIAGLTLVVQSWGKSGLR